ncbi:hypothetical protein [Amycolatopsis sp. NPDC058986]|uniref:hypothetical protein n=1 Tax=unclassified Amycolatopsis TaxID=2618356 RepID=UPI00366FF79C
MSAFLSELGRKLAEKWLSLLVLPGLLLLGACLAGGVLGQAHWADTTRLTAVARSWSTAVQASGAVLAVMIAAAVLLAAAALGVAATGLGWAVRKVWLDPWPRWAGWLLVRSRRARWNRATAAYETILLDARNADDPEAARQELDRLAGRRNRIGLVRPGRPTWIGDRMAAVDARVFAEYELDLGTAWPRLWLTVADATRTEVRAAATAFGAAATLCGWGLPYLALGVVWWPAAVLGLLIVVTAWRRGRSTVALYADLVESVVDLHAAGLADALGISAPPDAAGAEITSRLRKGA